MQHTRIVSDFERACNRIEHRGNHVKRQKIGVIEQQFGQRDALDVLHDEIGVAPSHFKIVHRNNSLIGQHRSGPSFVEPRDMGKGCDLVSRSVEPRQLVVELA